jgi:hypothetical protein
MADRTVPVRWVVLFLLLALGTGAVAIVFIGGNVVPSLFVPA